MYHLKNDKDRYDKKHLKKTKNQMILNVGNTKSMFRKTQKLINQQKAMLKI